jgi:hypothetical protein
LKHESVEYYRLRERAECEAALNATCARARHAHARMAGAYARLVELHELEQLGALPSGKVTSMSEALHEREQTAYGGRREPVPDPEAHSR